MRIAAAPAAGLLALSLCALAPTRLAHADEPLFGYVRNTDVLPKGAKEIELWATQRSGKGQGHYTAYDYRVELEYGFTDRLLGSLYLNGIQQNISGVPGLEDLNQTRANGFSTEIKYNILSPYKDGIGLTLYFEPEYAKYNAISGERSTEYALEMKLLLQKNFLDDRLIWGFNLNSEFAREQEGDRWAGEAKLGYSTGVSYRFAPGWYGGVELEYRSVWPDFAQRSAWGLFAGPTIHYGAKSWWATLTWLPQLQGRPIDPELSSRLQLQEFEKNEIRLRVGFLF